MSNVAVLEKTIPNDHAVEEEKDQRQLKKADAMVFHFIDKYLGSATAGDDATILVVEDEPIVGEILVDVMHDCGFSTIQVENAEQAVPYLTDDSQRIDLMLSDVGLPGMDGHELAHVARDYRPNLKVLFITGNPADALLRDELLDDHTDVMIKPFRANEVADHVAAML